MGVIELHGGGGGGGGGIQGGFPVPGIPLGGQQKLLLLAV